MMLQIPIDSKAVLHSIAMDNELMPFVIENKLITEDIVVQMIEEKKLSVEMILGKLAVNKFMNMQNVLKENLNG
jgi:hypothetical protein